MLAQWLSAAEVCASASMLSQLLLSEGLAALFCNQPLLAVSAGRGRHTSVGTSCAANALTDAISAVAPDLPGAGPTNAVSTPMAAKAATHSQLPLFEERYICRGVSNAHEKRVGRRIGAGT